MIAREAVIREIVQRHFEEAVYLWQLRQRAVLSAEYVLDDLAELDDRMQAHLDGLIVAVEDGWQVSAEAFEENGSGAVFASAWLLLRQREADKVIALVEQSAQEPQFYSALLTAFGRVPSESLKGIVRSLLAFPSGKVRQLGIEACVAHGVPPGPTLASCLTDEDTELCICGIRSCATLGLIDYSAAISRLLSHDDPKVRVAAASGLLLLGDRGNALRVLIELLSSTAFTLDAATLLVSAVSTARASELLKALAARPKGISLLINTVAANGDPYYAPWLLREMQKPLIARLAGYAFEAITGADIRRVAQAKAPDGELSGTPDAPADLDDDEQNDLPWPDVAKLNRWWGQTQHRWQTGTRYLLGRPLSVAACMTALKQGNQRQRALASRQLCLVNPGTPVFNIHAPAWRQRQELSRTC